MDRGPLEGDYFSTDLMELKRARRGQQEPSLVPIIDMMTTIIFFLVLTTSFTAYTKHTLPPSGISTSTDTAKTPPLQPMLLLKQETDVFVVELSWQGSKPDKKRIQVSPGTSKKPREVELREKVSELIGGFLKDFPKERTLLMGMTSQTKYQFLVSAMDGAQPLMPDIVLLDYMSTESRIR